MFSNRGYLGWDKEGEKSTSIRAVEVELAFFK
jgi:hypothetical protein